MAISSDFQSFVDEVIEKNDIVEIVSEYTKLKRVGSRHQGLCPLHNDKKSPSFSVSSDKQLFHCFGCGAGGTVINFIMQAENLDFMEALKFLAERARIPMPENRSSLQKNEIAKIHDKKQRLYKINSEAGKFFYSQLNNPANKTAKEYILKRNLSEKIITTFGIGYAPDSWDSLIKHLKSLGYSEKEIEECGLCVRREHDKSYFDKFRGRIMFPIIDLRGNIIGFGGRIINDKGGKEAKYLNSPETLIFKKKENLFAMNFAKNSNEDKLLVMEGYMDVISLHQKGFTNAVASLGTAFTPEQANLIKRYKGRAILCYDSDEAGKKATLRAGDILQEAGLKTKVLTLKGAKDPDEYINLKGAEMFKDAVKNAKNLTEYRIAEIEQQYNLNDAQEKTEFINKVSFVFSGINDLVEREICLKDFSSKYDISVAAVETHINNHTKKKETQNRRREETAEKKNFEKRTGGRKDIDGMRLYNAEQLLLNLISERSVYVSFAGEISADDFSDGVHKKLAQIIMSIHSEKSEFNSASVLMEFSEEEISEVAKILSDDKNVDDKKKAAMQSLDIIKQVRTKREEKRLAESGDIDSLQEMINQLKKTKG